MRDLNKLIDLCLASMGGLKLMPEQINTIYGAYVECEGDYPEKFNFCGNEVLHMCVTLIRHSINKTGIFWKGL